MLHIRACPSYTTHMPHTSSRLHLTGASPRSPRARAACSLRYKLAAPRLADMAVLQLMDQENLMVAWLDNHPEPNIDVATLRLYGHRVPLPPGAELAGAADVAALQAQHNRWAAPAPRQRWPPPAPPRHVSVAGTEAPPPGAPPGSASAD